MLSMFILYKPTLKYCFCCWKVLLKLCTHKYICKAKHLQIHFSCSINQSIWKWPALKPTFWQGNMDQYLTQPFHWSQGKFSQHLMCHLQENSFLCNKLPATEWFKMKVPFIFSRTLHIHRGWKEGSSISEDYACISLLNVYSSLGNNQLGNVCDAQAIITKMRCITFIIPANS